MSEALSERARRVEELLYAHPGHFAAARRLAEAHWDEPAVDAGGGVIHFPWPQPPEEDFGDPTPAQTALAMTPAQVVWALAALREVHCRGVVPVVAVTGEDLRRSVGWNAAVRACQGLGDYAAPWFDVLLARFEQILSSGEATPPAPEPDPREELDAFARKVRGLLAALQSEVGDAETLDGWWPKLGRLWEEARSVPVPGGRPVPGPPARPVSREQVVAALRVLLAWAEGECGRLSGTPSDPPSPLSPVPGPASAVVGSIRKNGGVWELRYGAKHGAYPVSEFKALATVARLVARPHHPFDLKDLVDPATGTLLDLPGAREPVFDDPAVSDLLRRLRGLASGGAGGDDPLVRQEDEQERAQIRAELKKHMGPGWRKRAFGRSAFGQAWDALTKGLKRLWPRLAELGMPELAAHLEAAVLIDCPTVTYHPPAGTAPWDTDD